MNLLVEKIKFCETLYATKEDAASEMIPFQNKISPLTTVSATPLQNKNIKLETDALGFNIISEEDLLTILGRLGLHFPPPHDSLIEQHQKLANQLSQLKEEGSDQTIQKDVAWKMVYLADIDTVLTRLRGNATRLGKGSFSVVHQAFVSSSPSLENALLAYKKPRKKTYREMMKAEADVHNELSQANNIVKCHFVNQKDFTVKGLYLEAMKGTLNSYRPNNLGAIVRCAKQIANGLQEMHEKGYVHRDLHCGNIFLSFDNVWKIGDLGLAQKFNQISNKRINYAYASPRLLESDVFDTEILTQPSDDIWSLGIIFYILENGFPPPFATSDACRPLCRAVMFLKSDQHIINSLPFEMACAIFDWNGQGELEIPDDFHVATTYVNVKNKVRQCYEERIKSINEFCENYAPTSEFGKIVKGMLSLEGTERTVLPIVIQKLNDLQVSEPEEDLIIEIEKKKEQEFNDDEPIGKKSEHSSCYDYEPVRSIKPLANKEVQSV
jgi:serine/threonine protein kinase